MWNRDGSDVSAFPNEIDNGPMVLPTLKMIESEVS